MISKWTTLLEQRPICDCGETMTPMWHTMNACESLTGEVVYHCKNCGADKCRETIIDNEGEVVSDEVARYFFG